MRWMEIEEALAVGIHTYKAQVRVPRAGGYGKIALWVTITAPTQIAARSMLEAQYGKGSVVCQPAMVSEDNDAMLPEDQTGSPEQERAKRMKANAKMQADKAKQMKAQAEVVATQEKMKRAKQRLAHSGTPPGSQVITPR